MQICAITLNRPQEFKINEGFGDEMVMLSIDSEVNIFMSYEKAIDLSRKLRIAAGVDEAPQAEAA